MAQTAFDFTPGLTVQFKSPRAVLAATVHGSRIGLDGCAAACDLSPSELSRMLNRGQADQRALDVDHITAILGKTEDFRLIYWLIERFLQDPDRMRANAAQQLAQLLPAIIELAHQAGVSTPLQKSRR
jgi:hypothetical protein